VRLVLGGVRDGGAHGEVERRVLREPEGHAASQYKSDPLITNRTLSLQIGPSQYKSDPLITNRTLSVQTGPSQYKPDPHVSPAPCNRTCVPLPRPARGARVRVSCIARLSSVNERSSTRGLDSLRAWLDSLRAWLDNLRACARSVEEGYGEQ
jgi:hypothetical protein